VYPSCLNENAPLASQKSVANDCEPRLTASFQYDGLGRRKQKTLNGATTTFLYDGLNVVQKLNGSTPVANLLTGIGVDEMLTRTDAAGTRAFFTDGLGSTLALVDSAGTLQTQYTYEPFGKTTVSGTTSTHDFQYTGRENDVSGNSSALLTEPIEVRA